MDKLNKKHVALIVFFAFNIIAFMILCRKQEYISFSATKSTLKQHRLTLSLNISNIDPLDIGSDTKIPLSTTTISNVLRPLISTINNTRVSDNSNGTTGSKATVHKSVQGLPRKANLKIDEVIEAKLTKFKDYMTVNNASAKNYISTWYIGGLGNQMFQWATIVGVGIHNGLSPYFQKFGSFQDTYYKRISNGLNITNWTNCPDRHFAKYDERVKTFRKDYPGQNIYLNGFYQSYRYFDRYSHLIKQEFTPSSEVIDHVKNFYMQFNKTIQNRILSSVRVAIHIRRGNIMDDEHIKYGYLSPNGSYFENAIALLKGRIGKPLFFVVCSNDIDWVNTHIKPLDQNMIVSEHQSQEVDMAILSSCDHVIMSSGTYGWWGGYLAGGDVVYYSNYPRKGSFMDEHFSKKDHFMPHWIGIE